MRVLDLFAGLGGWGFGFRQLGHEVIGVDLVESFDTEVCANVFDLNPVELHEQFGRFDVVTASPPCECFSVLRIGRNWTKDNDPKTPAAWGALMLVWRTRHLIEALRPAFFVVENPRSKLRKLPPVQAWERRTVTYCQYGAPWQKPTDLWGGFPPSFSTRPVCSPEATCHVPAPRGSRTSIQSDSAHLKHPLVLAWEEECRRNIAEVKAASHNWNRRPKIHEGACQNNGDKDPTRAAMRALIPPQLSLEFAQACERDLEGAVRGERLFA